MFDLIKKELRRAESNLSARRLMRYFKPTGGQNT